MQRLTLKCFTRSAALAAVFASIPALAHHSVSMFDTGKTVTLVGTVTELDWANPHSMLFMDARPADQPNTPISNWNVQLEAPAGLNGIGWEKDSIRVGDTVKVYGYPRKDGRPQILFTEIDDGKGHHFVTSRSFYDKYK